MLGKVFTRVPACIRRGGNQGLMSFFLEIFLRAFGQGVLSGGGDPLVFPCSNSPVPVPVGQQGGNWK